ncbi:hypothetical protein [Streptomyces zhihengii]|uniref:Uncharacterized protein n=1 Tax=Streptomyces zhihengii TaxID=1818004 RepID=A0ABS2V3R2_9ACTN|nr:hypothetical protein [Streptomyces zhihengii]MBM9624338.1 hypothetical protein [Streptomyces zhihengii]
MRGTGKQTNIRLDEVVKAAAEERAKSRGLSLQGYVADLIEADVNQSRAAFLAGAASFLSAYAERAFRGQPAVVGAMGENAYGGWPCCGLVVVRTSHGNGEGGWSSG